MFRNLKCALNKGSIFQNMFEISTNIHILKKIKQKNIRVFKNIHIFSKCSKKTTKNRFGTVHRSVSALKQCIGPYYATSL